MRVDIDTDRRNSDHAANDGRMPGGGSFGLEAGRDRDGGLHIAGALRRSRIYGIYGGVAKLVLPTGGYIVGFLFTALIVGAASDSIKIKNVLARMALLAAAMAVGIAVCYAFGTAWFMALYARAEKSITLAGALSLCVVPYLLPDLVKVVFAAALVAKLKKYMKI